ncbi:STAS/SEC14 domain-containing protein [Planctomycetota bacterium]
MPIEYDYDEKANFITTRFYGVITDEDLEKQANALGGDPRIKKGARELADLSDVEASESEVTPDSVQKMVDIDCAHREKYGNISTAVVAPTDLTFSLARVFELTSDLSSSPFKVRVFTNREEAMGWLDEIGGQAGTVDIDRGERDS